MSGFPKRDENLMPFEETTNGSKTTEQQAAEQEAHLRMVPKPSEHTDPGAEPTQPGAPTPQAPSSPFHPLTTDAPAEPFQPMTVEAPRPFQPAPADLKPFAENFPPATDRTFVADEKTQVPTGDLVIPPAPEAAPSAAPAWRAKLSNFMAHARENVHFAYDRFMLLPVKQQRLIYAGSAAVAALFTTMMVLPKHRPASTFHAPHVRHVPPPVVEQQAPPPDAQQANRPQGITQPPPVVQHVEPPKPAVQNVAPKQPVTAPKQVAKAAAKPAVKTPAKAKAATPAKVAKAAPPKAAKGKKGAPAKTAAKSTKDKKGKAVASAKGKSKATSKKSKVADKGKSKKKDAKKLAKKKTEKKRSIASDGE